MTHAADTLTEVSERLRRLREWAAIAQGKDGAAPSVLVGPHMDELEGEDGHRRFAVRHGFIDIGALR